MRTFWRIWYRVFRPSANALMWDWDLQRRMHERCYGFQKPQRRGRRLA